MELTTWLSIPCTQHVEIYHPQVINLLTPKWYISLEVGSYIIVTWQQRKVMAHCQHISCRVLLCLYCWVSELFTRL